MIIQNGCLQRGRLFSSSHHRVGAGLFHAKDIRDNPVDMYILYQQETFHFSSRGRPVGFLGQIWGCPLRYHWPVHLEPNCYFPSADMYIKVLARLSSAIFATQGLGSLINPGFPAFLSSSLRLRISLLLATCADVDASRARINLAVPAPSKPRGDDRLGGALRPGVFLGFVVGPGADDISSEPAIDGVPGGEVGWPVTTAPCFAAKSPSLS